MHRSQLFAVLGLITYYCGMWSHSCSHILAPLTNLLTTPKTYNWPNSCWRSFEEMKFIMAVETMLVYPDLNQHLHILQIFNYAQLSNKKMPLLLTTLASSTKHSSITPQLNNYFQLLKALKNVGQCFLVQNHTSIPSKNLT